MISGGMRSGEVGLSIDSKLKVGVVRYLNSDTHPYHVLSELVTASWSVIRRWQSASVHSSDEGKMTGAWRRCRGL